MIRWIWLLTLMALTASSQPMRSDAILADLERRAMAALDGIARAHGREEAEARKPSLRAGLEADFRMDRPMAEATFPAQLAIPDKLTSPAAAVVILHPHDDPGGDNSVKLTRGLIGAGIAVLNLDLRPLHSRLDLLSAGFTPESLMQRAVRGALLHLSSRKDIDPRRIGLIGDGIGVSFAAALNEQFSAIAIINGAPDLRNVALEMHSLQGDALPDSCYLVPNFVRSAAPQDLFAMIAPRPVLTINSSQAVADYSSELYAFYGKSENLRQITGEESSAEICSWFARWFQNADWRPAPESGSTRAQVDVHYAAPGEPSGPSTISLNDVQATLGEPLPEGTVSFGLKVATAQHITLETQKGFALPVTVFRPGPAGGGAELATLIAISDAGEETLAEDEIVREAVRRNWIVWAVDPRGMGSLKVAQTGLLFTLNLWLGESLVWRQASDVLRIMEGVGGFNQNREAALYARGPNSSAIAAFVAARAARNMPAWAAVREGANSFWDPNMPAYLWPFGMMGAFDIPSLTAHAPARTITILNIENFKQADW